MRAQGEGPFAPDHEKASQDKELTKCRHCEWYNRFFHENFDSKYGRHPVGCQDWCHACGRVASDKDLGKKQSTVYQPGPNDIFLGTKEISFRLHVRDPTTMAAFSARWKENSDKWVYDDIDQHEELFYHRLGDRPDLTTLLASIPIASEDKIPKDGKANAKSSLAVSAEETECVLLDHPGDLRLLEQIYQGDQNFGANDKKTFYERHRWLFGDLSATWDRDIRKGVSRTCMNMLHFPLNLTLFSQIVRVRVFVRSLTSLKDYRYGSPTAMSLFLGTWFGVLPFKLEELNLNLTAAPAAKPPNKDRTISVPPFKLNQLEYDTTYDTAIVQEQLVVDQYNLHVNETRENLLTLESGTGSALLGGVCLTYTDFQSTLMRYFREILPECLITDAKYYDKVPNFWFDDQLGIVSDHRSMRRFFTNYAGVDTAREVSIRTSNTTCDIDPYLSREDCCLVRRTREDAESLYRQTDSLAGLMNHLENRGHAAAPFVEGLTVELLPFQEQSLQWAIERETVPGGIQSYFWIKLPNVVEEPNTEVYYNPILGRLSKSKPNLVRGGIIAEQMGLGKTVISLALILQNPAPAAPLSGSPVSSIPAQAAPESPFWDPNVYTRTLSSNEKRGSIISRGTLVVVSLSSSLVFLCNWTHFGTSVADAKNVFRLFVIVQCIAGGAVD
jgi:SNF2-related domain